MFFRSNKIKFFIVEDDTLYKYMLNHTIHEAFPSYFIETFTSVEELLDPQILTPNIILLDHFLPGIKGIEALSLLKNKFPTSHIIVISSQGDTDLTNKVLATPNCSYLSKQDFSISNFTYLINKIH